MRDDDVDPVIAKARKLFEKSGKTLDEIGLAMGYEGATARKAVWQLLNKIDDPRIKTLRQLAKALGVSVKDLL